MDRRTPAARRAVPACAECDRLDRETTEAEAAQDPSRATDCRVLLARHQRTVHRGEQ